MESTFSCNDIPRNISSTFSCSGSNKIFSFTFDYLNSVKGKPLLQSLFNYCYATVGSCFTPVIFSNNPCFNYCYATVGSCFTPVIFSSNILVGD
jgi:hypothetical protein